MNKIITILICILVVLIGIVTSMFIVKKNLNTAKEAELEEIEYSNYNNQNIIISKNVEEEETMETDGEIYKEKEEGENVEKYVVKDLNGKVVVYKKTSQGELEFFEETSISTDYLTDTDRLQMKEGIEVNGKKELYQLMEDYE